MIVNKLFILFIDHTQVQQALPGDLEIYNFGRPRVTQGIWINMISYLIKCETEKEIQSIGKFILVKSVWKSDLVLEQQHLQQNSK